MTNVFFFQLWTAIDLAVTFGWPTWGVPARDLFGIDSDDIPEANINLLDKFLNGTCPSYEKVIVGDVIYYKFGNPAACKRFFVTNILMVNHYALLRLFTELFFEDDPEEAVPISVFYTKLLQWARSQDIPVTYLPKKISLMRYMEEIGYDRCKFQNESGIFGLKNVH